MRKRFFAGLLACVMVFVTGIVVYANSLSREDGSCPTYSEEGCAIDGPVLSYCANPDTEPDDIYDEIFGGPGDGINGGWGPPACAAFNPHTCGMINCTGNCGCNCSFWGHHPCPTCGCTYGHSILCTLLGGAMGMLCTC